MIQLGHSFRTVSSVPVSRFTGAASGGRQTGTGVSSRDLGSAVASQAKQNALDHVVVVVFENRSLDNVLGRLYGPEDFGQA